MRPVRVLSLYLAFIFVGGALISPWLYTFFHAAGGFFPSLQSVASKPFPKFVSRSFQILALIGLIPFLRASHLQSWRELGLTRRPNGFKHLLLGFLLGLLSLACVVVLALAVGARESAHEHGPLRLAAQIIKGAMTAAVVAPLEEIVFRGALFGTLRRTFHWTVALVISSVIYALLHFLEDRHAIDPVVWNSGLVVLGRMIAGFLDVGKMVPAVLSLTAAGMILGLAYQRTGSLHFPIGLHAGWIFWLKTYGAITDDTANNRAWLFGSAKMIDGWLAFVLLASCFLLLSRWLVSNDPHSGWKERRLLS